MFFPSFSDSLILYLIVTKSVKLFRSNPYNNPVTFKRLTEFTEFLSAKVVQTQSTGYFHEVLKHHTDALLAIMAINPHLPIAQYSDAV